jgi:diguanylate cyclase (GGDEF)-like protein/PAS domain S-box-containing protein
MDRIPRPLACEQLLAALLESAEDGVLSVALDGTIETWSHGAERLYGYTAEEIIGQPLSRLVPLYELQALEKIFSQVTADQSGCYENAERLHKDGSRIFIRMRRVPIRGEQGQIEGILERSRALNGYGGDIPLETGDQLLMEQMPLILWTTDQNLRITSNWGRGLPPSKLRAGGLVGSTVFEFLRCADRHTTPIAEHYDALRGVSAHFEYNWRDRILEICLEPLRTRPGAIIGCLGVGMDITDRRRDEEEAHYLARHDALTGLANYREFIEKLEREVQRAERSHRPFTLLLLDLDGLKRINDLQGHLVGNRGLRRLAAVMNQHCRSTDLAARYGGDEFAVMLIDSDQGMAEQIAQRIERGLPADQEEPALSVSIGIGIYPDDGRTAAELLEAADRQLYRRKKAAHRRASVRR